LKIFKKIFLGIIILGIVWRSSEAQSKNDSLEVKLEPIKIHATHFGISPESTPLSVSYVSRSNAELVKTPALTLDRITYKIPGLWVSNRENYALGERITIRGLGWRAAFGVRGIQVIMDGIPLTTADGQSVLNIVDPAFIREMKVIRGPASAFWGNSSGGVLYLSTRPPKDINSQVRVREMLGSYGMNKTDVQLTQKIGLSRFSAYSSYLHSDGYRDYSKARLSRTGLTGNIPLTGRSGINLFGAYESMPEAQHPGTLTKQQVEQDPRQARAYFADNNAGKMSIQGQLGGTYHDVTGIGTFRMTAYGIFRDLKNPLPFVYIKLHRLAGGLRLTLQNENKYIRWNVGYGGKLQHDFRWNWNNSRGTPLPGDSLTIDQLEKVYNQAVFGNIMVPLNKWNISLSLRYDWLRFSADDHLQKHSPGNSQSGKRNFQALSPSAGISYQINDSRIYASMSTAFEAPTTTELVNRPDGGGGYNPNLQPEHTLNFETGVKGQIKAALLSYNLALYTLWVRDMLMPYESASERVYYRNEGKTHHWGIEANVDWKAQKHLNLGVTYTFTHATFVTAQTLLNQSLDHNTIPGIPRQRLNGFIRWSAKPIWFSLDAESVNAYYVDNLNTAKNEGYIVFNGRISTESIRFSSGISLDPFISINNIFDKQYNGSVQVNATSGRYFEPAAGRNWTAGVAITF
jgi:iron complex outermembrane receptor protein